MSRSTKRVTPPVTHISDTIIGDNYLYGSSLDLYDLVQRASAAIEKTNHAKENCSGILKSVDVGHQRLNELIEREEDRRDKLYVASHPEKLSSH